MTILLDFNEFSLRFMLVGLSKKKNRKNKNTQIELIAKDTKKLMRSKSINVL
ncbi:hypothetical protein [Subsaximicrobium wynnwilliamsii]|uniref:hypothetical protein n=1 Tax=Subsaximicrobium wynnwilliamsii TaxID=291179 RepID=UPI00167B6078|nr:hypothetical protein [Subsaximicrobium wynnwilliamsii]